MGTGFKQSFIQPLTEVSTTQKDDLGDIRREGNKKYKYVKLQNTSATVAGAAGDPVAYAAEDAGYPAHLVVVDLTDADAKPLCAGFLLATVTGTAGTAYYVWIQIGGNLTTTQAIGGTPADGGPVTLSTTDKTLTRADAADAAILPQVCAYAIDASAKTIIAACPE